MVGMMEAHMVMRRGGLLLCDSSKHDGQPLDIVIFQLGLEVFGRIRRQYQVLPDRDRDVNAVKVHGWRLVCAGPGVRWAHSSSKPQDHWETKIQDHYNRFSEVEFLVNSIYFFRRWRLQSQNKNFEFTRKKYGKNVGAAHFILSRGGGVRFAGQDAWYRAKKGKFSWDFLNHVDVKLEEVDASGLPINYDGFDNLEEMEQLKALYLRNCPNVDDWCLNRLHIFRESLEELHLTGCPLITDRGLVSLHNLTKLRYLELSHLPLVAHKGLIKILVEEMLPNTTVVMEDAPSLSDETLAVET